MKQLHSQFFRILALMFCLSAWLSLPAQAAPESVVESGVLTMPKVAVDSNTFNQARLALHEDGDWYLLDTAGQENVDSRGQGYPEYAGGVLQVPLVRYGTNYYQDARFLLVAEQPALRFRLTEYTPVAQAEQIHLLLHGMASKVGLWDELVNAEFDGVCPVILDGVFTEAAPATAPECARVAFKNRSREGLEGLTEWEHGDGATFAELGREVEATVAMLATAYPQAKIILAGHSRGGLAARAFVQNAVKSHSPLLDKINGLLTIGTPHQGSAFGRFHVWLAEHPRPTNCIVSPLDGSYYCPSDPDAGKDWSTADFIRAGTQNSSDAIGPLDLRAPTVGFLREDAEETAALNRDIGLLDLPIVLAQIISTQVRFGDVHMLYDVWGTAGPHPSEAAKSYILNGQPKSFYAGDGIVPTVSQRMNLVPGFPAGKEVLETELTGYIRHLDEPLQVQAIGQMFARMRGQ